MILERFLYLVLKDIGKNSKTLEELPPGCGLEVIRLI